MFQIYWVVDGQKYSMFIHTEEERDTMLELLQAYKPIWYQRDVQVISDKKPTPVKKGEYYLTVQVVFEQKEFKPYLYMAEYIPQYGEVMLSDKGKEVKVVGFTWMTISEIKAKCREIGYNKLGWLKEKKKPNEND